MKVEIQFLNEEYLSKYNDFILTQETTLLYYSLTYRLLLKEFLNENDYYFIALNNGEIVGVLPAFLKINDKYGNVLNSLPFYGSNGACIVKDDNENIKKELLNSFNEFAISKNCISSTIISSPFDLNYKFYNDNLSYDFIDQRIGQITELPCLSVNLEDDLINLFHSKTRNMVRKAIKSDIKVDIQNNLKGLEFVFSTHQNNMEDIGGIAKPYSFFETIFNKFKPNTEFNIFVATIEEKPIAALLLLYFNMTVEYFTPVVVKDYRTYQPLSLLIYSSMIKAVESNFQYWNWGGTWMSQDGVYDFKKRWGTKDLPYYYYTRIFDKSVINMTKEDLIREFPYFYVLPFSELKK